MEFRAAQSDFFQKNAHIFEDAEENKLSYTDVFESYVYLLDNTITAKLLEAGFDEQADLDPFYKGFKANIAKYEAENSDVVDTLYTFIDFSKFKENILDIKKAIDFKGTGNDNTNKAGFKIHTADDFWKLAKEDIDDPALGWKQMLEYKKKNGIAFKLWTRPMEGTHLHMS